MDQKKERWWKHMAGEVHMFENRGLFVCFLIFFFPLQAERAAVQF